MGCSGVDWRRTSYARGAWKGRQGTAARSLSRKQGIERPDRNLLETRLPVGHILYRKKDEPIPNPFEVATLYVDAFTQKQGSWRVQLILERWQNKNGDLWLVTVRDEGTKTDLVAVTMKSAQVELNALMAHDDDLLPLQRVTKLGLGQERPNVWNRLLGPAFPPLELGLSFEDEDPSS